MTYSQKKAANVNAVFRLIVAACGLRLIAETQTELRFADGSIVTFTSGDVGLTGLPITGVLIVDDLYKERIQADSPAYRQRIELMWDNSVIARLHRGASVLVLGTRWHPQDMYGKLVAEQRYKEVLLPAEAEAGDVNGRQVDEALFPTLFTSEELQAKKRDMLPSAWASLYQGRPRARGAGVFQQPSFYTVLPTTHASIYGIDLGYTTHTKSDPSVCLEMRFSDGKYYVTSCWTDRKLIEDTADVLGVKRDERPGQHMIWRASSTERASASLLKRPPYNLPIIVRSPPGDKLVSATAVAVDWNKGLVVLPDVTVYPQHAEWVKQLIDQALDFTGTGKEHDDIVDALGNAHNELRALAVANAVPYVGAGGRR